MAITWATILQDIRDNIGNQSYSETTALRHANEGYRLMAQARRPEAKATLSLVAAQSDYTAPAGLRHVGFITLADGKKLAARPREIVMGYDPDATGCPEVWCLWTGKIHVWPTPTATEVADATISPLSVYEGKDITDLALAADSPDMPDEFAMALSYYATARYHAGARNYSDAAYWMGLFDGKRAAYVQYSFFEDGEVPRIKLPSGEKWE